VHLPGHDKIAWFATKHEAKRSARFYRHWLPTHGLFAFRATCFEEKNNHEVEKVKKRDKKPNRLLKKSIPGKFRCSSPKRKLCNSLSSKELLNTVAKKIAKTSWQKTY
jgi:hypothetical protein